MVSATAIFLTSFSLVSAHRIAENGDAIALEVDENGDSESVMVDNHHDYFTWKVANNNLPRNEGAYLKHFTEEVRASIGDDLKKMKIWCEKEGFCVGFARSTTQWLPFYPKHYGTFDIAAPGWTAREGWQFYYIDERSRPENWSPVDENTDVSTLGYVSETYTFGAPATTKEPLTNLQRADGCFPGLRVYTENIHKANKQIDAASIFSLGYKHALTPVVTLHANSDSYYHTCEDPKPHWPKMGGGIFANWGLHFRNNYWPRLHNVTVNGKNVAETEPFSKANKLVALAYSIYDTDENITLAVNTKLPGWRLVANERTVHKHDEDKILIIQEESTLECAIVFEGTNCFKELGSSIKQHATGYCGYHDVHAGFRDELWVLTYDLFPKLREKLSKCSAVACTGHSLGGAVCELFAGCANAKRVEDADYRLLAWIQKTPELMPWIETPHRDAA